MKRKISLTGKFVSYPVRFHESVFLKANELMEDLRRYRRAHLPEGLLIVPSSTVCLNDVIGEAMSEGLLEVEQAGGIPARIVDDFYAEYRGRQCSVRLDSGFVDHMDSVGERINVTKGSMFALTSFIGVRILEKKFEKKAKVA